MKRFKTRKKTNTFKIIFFIIIVLLSFNATKYLLKNNVKLSPEKYIKYLVANGFNNQVKLEYNNYFDITKPLTLIEHNLEFMATNKNEEENNQETIEYIKKVNESMETPLVYIYNSHDTEKYKIEYKYEYTITPDVKLTSYILQEKLDNLGIKSIVETRSVNKILENNNWPYRESYKASKSLIEDAKNKYPSIKYFIDIHRDSSNYDKTILEYNNKKYAKILFVVGLEHDNYEYNLNIANKLNEMLNQDINNITRGVTKKEGLGVNGVYNQDVSKNALLIEIGGVDNTIDEVSNSVNLLGEVLSRYIKEDNNAKTKA